MRVLGIDPGIWSPAWAMLDSSGDKIYVVGSGHWERATKKPRPHEPVDWHGLALYIRAVIAGCHDRLADALAVEGQWAGVDADAAFKVSQSAGMWVQEFFRDGLSWGLVWVKPLSWMSTMSVLKGLPPAGKARTAEKARRILAQASFIADRNVTSIDEASAIGVGYHVAMEVMDD